MSSVQSLSRAANTFVAAFVSDAAGHSAPAEAPVDGMGGAASSSPQPTVAGPLPEPLPRNPAPVGDGSSPVQLTPEEQAILEQMLGGGDGGAPVLPQRTAEDLLHESRHAAMRAVAAIPAGYMGAGVSFGAGVAAAAVFGAAATATTAIGLGTVVLAPALVPVGMASGALGVGSLALGSAAAVTYLGLSPLAAGYHAARAAVFLGLGAARHVNDRLEGRRDRPPAVEPGAEPNGPVPPPPNNGPVPVEPPAAPAPDAAAIQ